MAQMSEATQEPQEPNTPDEGSEVETDEGESEATDLDEE